MEGLTFVALYAIYVVTVVQFERIMQVCVRENGRDGKREKGGRRVCVCVRERERV